MFVEHVLSVEYQIDSDSQFTMAVPVLPTSLYLQLCLCVFVCHVCVCVGVLGVLTDIDMLRNVVALGLLASVAAFGVPSIVLRRPSAFLSARLRSATSSRARKVPHLLHRTERTSLLRINTDACALRVQPLTYDWSVCVHRVCALE